MHAALRRQRHSEDDVPEFVRNVVSCLAKRSKAIKQRGARVEFHVVKAHPPEKPNASVEVLVSYSLDGATVRLRVYAWDDRWIWVDVRRPTKRGWAWSVTCEGRFLDQVGAAGVISRVEETISATHEPDREIPTLVNEIWADCLARGPRAV